jgi:hypothetical protein
VLLPACFANSITLICALPAAAAAAATIAHLQNILAPQVYDAKKGTFTDLGMLDVQQIFGRAGRPQFDTSGEANIITAHSKLAHYLGGWGCLCILCGCMRRGGLSSVKRQCVGGAARAFPAPECTPPKAGYAVQPLWQVHMHLHACVCVFAHVCAGPCDTC